MSQDLPPHTQRYVRALIWFTVAYFATLAAVLVGLWVLGEDSPWRFFLALLPMLPALRVAVAMSRFLRDLDELQRRIQLEGLGLAFAATALVTFCYGFLQHVGLPPLDAIWIGPTMVVLWLAGTAFADRRYR